MRPKLTALVLAGAGLLGATCYAFQQKDVPPPEGMTPAADNPVWKWQQHDRNRPLPPVIQPAVAPTQDQPGRPPSDAVVLFDGKDLSNWESIKGGPAHWNVVDGCLEVAKGTGDIKSKQGFGDCQLHVEFREPTPPVGMDQSRGNSGVFLQGLYEVQVLDCYGNKTYADGQTAALYGQYPPLVNACLPPGQWQTYDIIFHRPRFERNGNLVRPARISVLHNGVLVQDDVVLTGPTGHYIRPPFVAGADKLPLALQDHGAPVRYRNIWMRELPEK
jgi:hypothetical protein